MKTDNLSELITSLFPVGNLDKDDMRFYSKCLFRRFSGYKDAAWEEYLLSTLIKLQENKVILYDNETKKLSLDESKITQNLLDEIIQSAGLIYIEKFSKEKMLPFFRKNFLDVILETACYRQLIIEGKLHYGHTENRQSSMWSTNGPIM